MVRQQIESRGVRDHRVLAALRAVPRHRFVPADIRRDAYRDQPLPIGYDQTISQPFIVAYMSEQLRIDSHHRVLEIGTGSGYQSAVLAELAAEVYSIEILSPLAEQADKILAELGYDNIHVRIGDGYQGWPEHAPFDRIILTAAPPELPQALVDQLAPNGRLIAPVGPLGQTQELILVVKSKDGQTSRRTLIPVQFVPMVRGGQ